MPACNTNYPTNAKIPKARPARMSPTATATLVTGLARRRQSLSRACTDHQPSGFRKYTLYHSVHEVLTAERSQYMLHSVDWMTQKCMSLYVYTTLKGSNGVYTGLHRKAGFRVNQTLANLEWSQFNLWNLETSVSKSTANPFADCCSEFTLVLWTIAADATQ